MKKILVYGLTAALTLSSATIVSATDTAPKSMEVKYGFDITSPDTNMKEDITIHKSGDNASASLSVSTELDGETISIDLPDYFKMADGTLYLNASAFSDMAETLTGMTDIKTYTRLFGITKDWVEVPPIDLTAIQFELPPFEAELPEIDESFSTDLQSVFMSMFTFKAEGDSVVYVINNDTVLQTADALDEYKEKHLGFVADYLTYVQDVMSNLSSVDVKPAIRNYLDAAAKGIMNSDSSYTEEQAKELVDNFVDAFVSIGLEEYAQQITSVPVADLWKETKVASLLTSVLEDNTFELKIAPSETGLILTLTVNGSTITADVEFTDAGLKATINDTEGNAAAVLEASFDESSVSLNVKDAAGAEIVSLKSDYKVDGDYIDATYDLTSSYQGDVSMHGYFTVAEWNDDGSLAAPEESCNLLDVVETVTPFILQSMTASESETVG